MFVRYSRSRFQFVAALAFFSWLGIRFLTAQPAVNTPATLDPDFKQFVQPFLKQNCIRCHNEDTMMSGVRVDQLDSALEERHLKLWEAIRHRVSDGTMPPKGMPQPSSAQREQMVDWISRGLEVARARPTPKNGLVRRLTVSQYRNTLRELLKLDDDLTEIVPPDAVSVDGFLNNKDTLQLSPLLLETYFEIAEEALNRSIVDPASKPAIQNFRMDLGAAINPNPLPEKLILGANSLLLDNQDFQVTQLTPTKPFPFEPDMMRTKYRFIEGYAGNDTVRGWKEYDSIYHSVFACMRGSNGYPTGKAYSTIPQGLLLRPAIPNDELFTADGTYGPKANFKISLRELPNNGRFRVTVTASKLNDGLLLDSGATPQSDTAAAITATANQLLTIPKPGLYQIDVHQSERPANPVSPDASKLSDGLIGYWPLDDSANTSPAKENLAGFLEAKARFVASPFAKAVSFDGGEDSVLFPRHDAMNIAQGDFTVSAWIRPSQLRKSGLISFGAPDSIHGWYLDMSDNRGTLHFEAASAENKTIGSMTSTQGVLRPNLWQHVTAVIRRGKQDSTLYVNGFPVAKGQFGSANLDNPELNLRLGKLGNTQAFHGEIDEVRIHRRALDEAEIQALLEPGRNFVKPPVQKPQDLTLSLGNRDFTSPLNQPAFLVARLEAGPLPLKFKYAGAQALDRILLTPIDPSQDLAKRYLAFEKRSPRLGVHLGLRRDCGSTFAPVGPSQIVSSDQPTRLVFEGAIRNFPSPDVEKENVNYLAGIREIAVRSEYTDGRDMPRLLIRSVEFEGPFYESWPPTSHTNIFIDSPRKGESSAYARQIIRSFATRAYRRPINPTEEATLIAVFEKSFATSKHFRNSIKDSLQVVLTSPQFLFLIESSATPEPEPIDSSELASKLSYFLWNGPPDRTTLQLATTGTLRKQLDSEVSRLIASPRFSQFVREFTAQWLSLDKFQVLEPDRKQFPNLTRHNRTQLGQEPIQFLQYLIRNNLPVSNLIDSKFVVANETVASYYNLGAKTESGFDFVAITHQRRDLGGVLAQASILAGLSDGRESNPIKRGAWLARKIIAEPPDPPPPNVPTLKEDSHNLTLRQRLEQHRNQPGCMQCHSKIDPWGVPFEEFDAAGLLKQKMVDTRSSLPDKTNVSDVNDLKRYLSHDRIDQVSFSFLKHLATYATGRNLSYNELNFLKKDSLKLQANGYRMQDMVHYIVNSKLFLEK